MQNRCDVGAHLVDDPFALQPFARAQNARARLKTGIEAGRQLTAADARAFVQLAEVALAHFRALGRGRPAVGHLPGQPDRLGTAGSDEDWNAVLKVDVMT